MTSTGPQRALAPVDNSSTRTRLASLLHALNQPLTGLQCSMELALAAPRSVERYVQTLSEGLDLVSRMRHLVQALREISDLQSPAVAANSVIRLDDLLRETAEELQPVAESRRLRLRLGTLEPLPVRADAVAWTALFFRVLESAISLSEEGSTLDMEATSEHGTPSTSFCWVPGPPHAHSPFSRPELGLLIAEAMCEHLGAACAHDQTNHSESWTFRIPVASAMPWLDSHHHVVNAGGQQ